MIAWTATPVGHFTVHMLTAATLGAIGWGLWWYANRGVDTEEQVAAIDVDLTAVEADMYDALWPHVVALTHLVYELMGQDVPEGEPTEEQPAVVDDDDGPPTDVSHPADMKARMWSLLHGVEQAAGRHRAENGGPSVDQVSDGIDTRLLPHVARDWNTSGSALGEEAAAGPKN